MLIGIAKLENEVLSGIKQWKNRHQFLHFDLGISHTRLWGNQIIIKFLEVIG